METIIKLGTVSKTDIQELQFLVHWRNAILETVPLLQKHEETLRNKAEKQLQEIFQLQNTWWRRMADKYGWQYGKDDVWQANTKDGTVYLRKTDKDDRAS